jgi:hypothetical protein
MGVGARGLYSKRQRYSPKGNKKGKSGHNDQNTNTTTPPPSRTHPPRPPWRAVPREKEPKSTLTLLPTSPPSQFPSPPVFLRNKRQSTSTLPLSHTTSTRAFHASASTTTLTHPSPFPLPQGGVGPPPSTLPPQQQQQHLPPASSLAVNNTSPTTFLNHSYSPFPPLPPSLPQTWT